MEFRLILVVDTTYNDRNLDNMLSQYGFEELPKSFKDENGKSVYPTLWLNPDDEDLDSICFVQ